MDNNVTRKGNSVTHSGGIFDRYKENLQEAQNKIGVFPLRNVLSKCERIKRQKFEQLISSFDPAMQKMYYVCMKLNTKNLGNILSNIKLELVLRIRSSAKFVFFLRKM